MTQWEHRLNQDLPVLISRLGFSLYPPFSTMKLFFAEHLLPVWRGSVTDYQLIAVALAPGLWPSDPFLPWLLMETASAKKAILGVGPEL